MREKEEFLGSLKPQHEHPIAQIRRYFLVDMAIEDARIGAGIIRGTYLERVIDEMNQKRMRRRRKGGA